MIKPSVLGMLEVGKACGLFTLEEAYSNYMNHYDCFFLISDYHSQYEEFVKEVALYEFITPEKYLVDISIDEAIKQIKEKTNG